MIVVICPKNHLSHLLDFFGLQLNRTLPNSLAEIRYVEIFKRRVAWFRHGMIAVFIERISQPLMTSIMSIGRKEHEYPFSMRNLKFFLPSK